jgi:hypothetical protein
MAKVKGSIYLQAREWVDGALGAGTFSRAVAEAGGTSTEIILPGTWLPVEPLIEAVAQAAAARRRPNQQAVAEIARLNALNDLTTIYRVFMRVAAPVRVLAHSPRVWGLYFDFGRPTIDTNEKGHFVGAIEEVPAHLVDFVQGALIGFLPAAVEMAGGKAPSARIRDASSARVVFEIRYR